MFESRWSNQEEKQELERAERQSNFMRQRRKRRVDISKRKKKNPNQINALAVANIYSFFTGSFSSRSSSCHSPPVRRSTF